MTFNPEELQAISELLEEWGWHVGAWKDMLDDSLSGLVFRAIITRPSMMFSMFITWEGTLKITSLDLLQMYVYFNCPLSDPDVFDKLKEVLE